MSIFKEIFSRTSRPISIKLGINHTWVKGIPNCLKKGQGPLQRGEITKMVQVHLKIFFRTTGPE
jgi:hypothetical protein